jgi:hypothetical protein
MTHEKIEQCRRKLVEVIKLPDSGERNKAFIELRKEVGASGCRGDMPTAAMDAENIESIHYALQTASMIDMCKTSNKNYKIAIAAAIVAIFSALGAVLSALAA